MTFYNEIFFVHISTSPSHPTQPRKTKTDFFRLRESVQKTSFYNKMMNLIHAFFVFASFGIYQSFCKQDKTNSAPRAAASVNPCHSLRKALRSALQELWETKDVRKQMEEAQRQLVEAKRQLSLADATANTLKQQLTEAQAELATTEDTANTLNQQLTEAQAELAYQENAADALKQQLTEAQAELVTKDATADALNQQLTKTKDLLGKQCAMSYDLSVSSAKTESELTKLKKIRKQEMESLEKRMWRESKFKKGQFVEFHGLKKDRCVHLNGTVGKVLGKDYKTGHYSLADGEGELHFSDEKFLRNTKERNPAVPCILHLVTNPY